MIVEIELDEFPRDCFECPFQIRYKEGVQDDWFLRRCIICHRVIEYPTPKWCPIHAKKDGKEGITADG